MISCLAAFTPAPSPAKPTIHDCWNIESLSTWNVCSRHSTIKSLRVSGLSRINRQLTWHQKQQLRSAGPWTAVFLHSFSDCSSGDTQISELRSATLLTFYERPSSTSPRTQDSRASTLHELGGAWCWCCWKGGTSTHESELCSFVSDVDVDMRSHFQNKLPYWLTHLFSKYLVSRFKMHKQNIFTARQDSTSNAQNSIRVCFIRVLFEYDLSVSASRSI